MSTIVVVRKNGIAAIGADTLTRLGSTKESAEWIGNPSKLVQVGSSTLGVTGHASSGLVLHSYFSQLDEPPALDSEESIFETVRQMHGVLKDEYHLNPTEDEDDEFESSQFSYLIANPHGIFGVYSRRSVQEYTRFYAFGAGGEFALGAMWAVYETATSAEEVARAGLEAAATFDDATGLPIEIRTVRLREA